MQKFIFKTLSVIAVTSLLLTGCGKEAPKKIEPDFRCKQDGILAPKWTCNPYVNNSIAAVGIAKMNAGNDKSMQKSEAMADGRDILAQQISIKVSNLFKSYKATTGSGKSATFDASTSKVSKQLASQSLNGSRSINSWKNSKTGELYLLVTVDNKNITNAMDKAIKTSYKNDQAMYQKFLAAKANGDLNSELEKAGLQ